MHTLVAIWMMRSMQELQFFLLATGEIIAVEIARTAAPKSLLRRDLSMKQQMRLLSNDTQRIS